MKDEDKFSDDYFENKNITVPIIIWWTPFTMDQGSFKKCSAQSVCFFTNLRKFRKHRSSSKAFMCKQILIPYIEHIKSYFC